MIKLTSILLMSFILNTAYLSASNRELSSKVDTTLINISPTVFIANDTSYDCFIIQSEFKFFIKKAELDSYIESQSQLIYTSNGEVSVKDFLINSSKDTLHSLTNSSYEINSKYITDSVGVPILLYDLQASYFFNLFQESYTSKFIYLLSFERVNRTDFKNYGYWFYTLYKIDLHNNSGSNFHFNTTSSGWNNDSIQMDSTVLSMKRLNVIEKNINLLAVYQGDLSPIEDSNQIYLLYHNNVRYIPITNYPPLNAEGMYSITWIKKYARKVFDVPFYEKK